MMHVEWGVKVAKAGKHLLIEKPVGVDCAEVRTMTVRIGLRYGTGPTSPNVLTKRWTARCRGVEGGFRCAT